MVSVKTPRKRFVQDAPVDKQKPVWWGNEQEGEWGEIMSQDVEGKGGLHAVAETSSHKGAPCP